MNNKVYAISRGSYDDYRIEGLFSTREKAQEYLNEIDIINADEDGSLEENRSDSNKTIDEWIVDELYSKLNLGYNLFCGRMLIDGTVLYIDKRIDELDTFGAIDRLNFPAYHLYTVGKCAESPTYHTYYTNFPYEYTSIFNILVFNIKAKTKDEVIEIVNRKRLELIDKGVFHTKVIKLNNKNWKKYHINEQ